MSKANVSQTRNCKWCGSEFVWDKKHIFYCSDECANEQKKKAIRENTKRWQQTPRGKKLAAISKRNTYLKNPKKAIAITAAWQKANPEKHRKNYFNANYQSKYGVDYSYKVELLVKQFGKCYFGCDFKGPHDTQLDHNHETGKVRAVVCNYCNKQIAKAERTVYKTKNYKPNYTEGKYYAYVDKFDKEK